MYLIKFKDEKDLLLVKADTFKIDATGSYAVFKNNNEEQVALFKMDGIRGIIKQNSLSVFP